MMIKSIFPFSAWDRSDPEMLRQITANMEALNIAILVLSK